MRETDKGKKAHESRTLLAGPWGGEFGWEIMTWIPALRHKAQRYKNSIVVCREEMAPLYDFAQAYIPYTKTGKTDRWLLNGKKVKIKKEIIERYNGATILQPSKSVCYNSPKLYKAYGNYTESCGLERETGYDIVIHARAMTKYGQQKLNWPVEKYTELLNQITPKRAMSMGTKSGAHWIPDTIDGRDIPIEALCVILANSKVCVGTSSGPMHLASLCKCPHVVMTGNEKLKSLHYHNNRWRYEKWWNPFGTPVEVVDKHGWKPPVKAVVKAIIKVRSW